MGEGMNGWEVASRVRALRPEMRIVLATGWAGAIDPGTARARASTRCWPSRTASASSAPDRADRLRLAVDLIRPRPARRPAPASGRARP